MNKIGIMLVGLLLLTPASMMASNLGVIGQTFPIQEENFLTFIHDRLMQMKKSGQLAASKHAFIKRVEAHALRPTPVDGLTTTSKASTTYYDPSIVLTQAIYDANGRLLIPSGTRVNPLDVVPFNETLIFFNGDDHRQVSAVQTLLAHPPTPRVKLILVGGGLKAAITTFHQKIYFDQQGRLTKKFGLEHVPCVITRSGNRLAIHILAIKGADA